MSVPSDQYFTPPEAKGVEPKKGHGCFFYGCIIAIVLVVLCILAVVVAGWATMRWLNTQVEQITDTAPMTLPKVTLSEDEHKDVRERMDAFKKALDEGKPATLTLTGDEITVLINDVPEFKDQVAVQIEGEKIKGEISKSLDFFKVPMINTKGRYLNGKAAFKVSLANNTLLVTIDELEVKGKPVPEQFMQSLRNENLAKNVQSNPDQARQVQRLESIVVKDGKITIKSRGADSESTTDEAEKGKDETPAKEEMKPEDGAKPEETAKPGDTEKGPAETPKEEAKPKEGEEPKEEAKPKEADAPKEEAKPKEGDAPADAPKHLVGWSVPPVHPLSFVSASYTPSFAPFV